MNSTDFSELIAGTSLSAVHLETRDIYFSNPRFEAWRGGARIDWEDRGAWWRPFHQQIADAVARGVVVRRARVVSEPVTEYIRWEHYQTTANALAGEQIRWLPRAQAQGLLLPVNDGWVFDDRLVRVHHFSGDGEWTRSEVLDDQGVATAYADAFEKIWEQATPHDEYRIK
ncbi:DUF6879 family protein [Streptomyces polygonati]|uniref:DUF6879 family protein n=1 Tax=Streptomyces polygonati TaxID=1617087 RepID=A0ABV8HZJ5_9ACTN